MRSSSVLKMNTMSWKLTVANYYLTVDRITFKFQVQNDLIAKKKHICLADLSEMQDERFYIVVCYFDFISPIVDVTIMATEIYDLLKQIIIFSRVQDELKVS